MALHDHFALLMLSSCTGPCFFWNFYLSLFFFKIKNAWNLRRVSNMMHSFLLIKLTLLSCLLKNTKAFYLKSLSMKIVEEDCSYDTTPDELIKSTENHTCQNFPLAFKVSDIFSPVWSHVFQFKSQINETFQTSSKNWVYNRKA